MIPMIEWLKCRRLLNRYWTDQEINCAMAALQWTIRDLTDETGFEGDRIWYKPYEIVKASYRFTVERSHPHCHDYTKRFEVNGRLIRIPATYQGLKHPALIWKLMSDKFPFMKEEIFFRKFPKKITFDFNKYVRLREIPEKFRKMTLEDLINHNEVQEIIENRSRWNFYSADMREDQDYQFYLDCDTEETENTYDKENQVYRQKGKGTLYINFKDWFGNNVDQFIEKSQYSHELLRRSPQFIALRRYLLGEAYETT